MLTPIWKVHVTLLVSRKEGGVRRSEGRGEWRREGVLLLIREVEAYSAMRVNFKLWDGGRDGWK